MILAHVCIMDAATAKRGHTTIVQRERSQTVEAAARPRRQISPLSWPNDTSSNS